MKHKGCVLHFSQKNIKWSCGLNLKPSLLPKFVQILFMFGLEKFRVVTIFFKDKKKKFLNLLWGPIIYGPDPFTRGESKSPSRGGLWPKLNNKKHKIALGYSRGQFSPRQIQNPTGIKGKTGIGLNLKRDLKYLGKVTLMTLPR